MRKPRLLRFARKHALALIALLHVALSVYTSVNVPLWESFDEPGHIFYARFIGQNGRLPPLGSKVIAAYDESHQPPLYYLLPAIPFALIDTSDDMRPIFTAGGRTWTVYEPGDEAWPWRGTALAIRLARFLSIIPGTLCVLITWRIARVLFPGKPMIAPVAAFAHAVWPMLNFMNGVVSNDTAIALMGSIVFWQMAELIKSPRDWRWWIGLAVAAAAATLTKDNGLTLFLTALGAILVVAAWRLLQKEGSSIPLFIASMSVAGVLTIGGFSLSEGRTVRQFDAAVGFTNRILALPPAVPDRQAPTGSVSPTPSGLSVVQKVNWIDAWVFAVGQYSWGTVAPPESWQFAVALFGVVLAASIVAGLVRGPYRRQILFCLVVVFAVMAAPLARGTALFVGGRFFLPALSAVCILIAESIARWRSHLVGRIWGTLLLGGLALFSLLAPPVILRPAAERPELLDPVTLPEGIEVRSGLVFGDAIELLGYSQPKPSRSVGDMAQIRLFWRALKPIPRDHGVRLVLYGIDGTSLEASWQQTPGNNNYPSSEWSPGATFVDLIEIPIRPHRTIPTLAGFKIFWFDQELNTFLPATCARDGASGGGPGTACEARIGRLSISASRATVFETMEAAFGPQVARFGDAIGMATYTLPVPVRNDAVATFKFQWRSLSPMDRNYVAFVHIFNSENQIVAQQDDQPRNGTYPTTSWRTSELIDDEIRVAIPASMPPGEYQVKLGFYEAASQERLPAAADPKQDPRNGMVTLGKILVIAKQP